jgi:hypothetical protein
MLKSISYKKSRGMDTTAFFILFDHDFIDHLLFKIFIYIVDDLLLAKLKFLLQRSYIGCNDQYPLL